MLELSLEEDMQENTRRRDDRTTKNAGAIRLFKVTAYERFLGFTGGGGFPKSQEGQMSILLFDACAKAEPDDASFLIALIFK